MRKIKNLQYFVLLFAFLLLSYCFPRMVAQADEIVAATDVESHWAAKQITAWTSKGLVGLYPDGTFQPDNHLTRAEFIALVNRAFGYTKQVPLSFFDVSETDWYAVEIAKAKAVGYISGYPDGTVRPNNLISRQEAAGILDRILRPVSEEAALMPMYADASTFPAWSAASINAVVCAGYMTGYPDNTFQPARLLTRAEAVAVLARAVGLLYNQGGIYGQEPETTTISGNVTISTGGVTLTNTIINGHLYLTEGIGDGQVTLNNVQVKGMTTVSGVGGNSIQVEDSVLGALLIDGEEDSKVRLVARGGTRIETVGVVSSSRLEEKEITDTGIGEVIIAIPQGAQVELVGAFAEVILEYCSGHINLLEGSVEVLAIAPASNGASINLAAGTTVYDLMVFSAASVTGTGAVQTAYINVDGCSLEPHPANIEIAEGITAVVAGEELTGNTP
jgi:hypothetical protein